MENPALGNDAVVDMGGGVVGQGDGAASEPGEKVSEEMEFEEMVEEGKGDCEKGKQVVPNGNEKEIVEQNNVGAAA